MNGVVDIAPERSFIMKKLLNKKGFTMAELLIVVAIIAVLVAISIPIFSAQLEKSRDATTLANLRNAYAEASSKYLTDNTSPVEIAVLSKGTANNSGLTGVGELSFTVDSALSTALDNGNNTSITVEFTFDPTKSGKDACTAKKKS